MTRTRSISYIFGGKPKNKHDCIDYASRYNLERIIVQLYKQEYVGDECICDYLKAIYVWIFDNVVVNYEEECGGVYSHEDLDRQLQSVLNANNRFDRTIEAIKEDLKNLGIDNVEIEGAKRKFELQNKEK